MNIFEGLNDEQKQAITHEDGPLLIVAGAGTGKTTAITKRVAWFVEQGKAKADEILALTFTEKAAGEMEERIDRLLPYGYVDLWVSTFHSFCEKILHNHALDIGLPNDFKILDQTKQWLLVRKNLDKFNLKYYRPLGNPTKFIHALTNHFSRCKDEEIYPDNYLEFAENLKLNSDSSEFIRSIGIDFLDEKKLSKKEIKEALTNEIKRIEEVANAYHVYQKLLLDNNVLDFGDLINYVLKLFRERPLILERYRNQFKYILVDEFQDTNWAQYELVKLLAAPNNNFTVCADDDQSIFRFRGASISNVLAFKSDYPASNQIVLTTNYRSKQNILDLAYQFITLNNPNRLEYQLNQEKSIKEAAQKKGINLLKFKKIDKQLKASRTGEGEIAHLHFKDLDEETRGVVNKIIELYNAAENANWNDFAILIRANNQADKFIQALSQARIPYQFLSSQGLYSKPIILDILSYLKLLDNYHESPALYRILNLSFLEIDSFDLIKLLHFSKRKSYSLYETIKQAVAVGVSNDTLAKLANLISLIDKHTSLAREKNVLQVAYSFIKEINYIDYLEKEDNQQNRENINYLNQFFKVIQNFEAENGDKSAKNFLDYINYVLESGDLGGLSPDLESGPEALKILTVHSAKGLEFKHVFIVNLVDKRFPSTERKDPISIPADLIKEILPSGDFHLEEERRLFYVAMTRAKDNLYFTSASDYGGVRKKKMSRFLYELGDKGFKINGESLVKEGKIKIISPVIPVVEGAKKELKYLIPPKFSYTQLKVFQICPWQYHYQFLLQIPVLGKATFSFGKTIHATLQRFFQKMLEGKFAQQKNLFGQKNDSGAIKLPSLDELLAIYEESWIDEWYSDKANQMQYYDEGKASLRNFYKEIENKIPNVIYLEKGFNIKVEDCTLKGQIDRIDFAPDGGIEIIDYKTGQYPQEKYLDKDQLLIYQLAASQIFGQNVSQLTYYYLNKDGNKKYSFLGGKKDLENIEEKIKKTINEIKTSDFPAKPSQNNCKYCDFKDICEFRIN